MKNRSATMRSDKLSKAKLVTRAKARKGALTWVNMVRIDREKTPIADLRPGVRRSWTMCPIAVSLRDDTDEHPVSAATWGCTFTNEDLTQEHVVPDFLARKFIEYFDVENAYSDLVLV